MEIRGSNPLVLTATGTVRIGGSIHLSGSDGTSDNSFDSAVSIMPGGKGGAGGGAGGPGHPIFHWPPGQISNTTLVSPPFGGNGFGPDRVLEIGGGGGQSGIKDEAKKGKYGTDQEISCNELSNNDNGSEAGGGSGGSFLTLGAEGRTGIGNVLVDGAGGYQVRTPIDPHWDELAPGAIGRSPFHDGNPDNDFIGVAGELKEIQGGQGGGGGGSLTEAYYCGDHCKADGDPTNDELCKGGEFGGAFADSVGDARGGGGGGGGGAILLQALGSIELLKTAQILAAGGGGGGGEALGRSNWGGPAASGSGGAILLQSADSIKIRNGAEVDVRGGSLRTNGGHGIIQLQVPLGEVADVLDPNDLKPTESWVDQDNTKNPARFTPFSAAVSRWFDMGRTIARDPVGSRPTFSFRGLDGAGFVETDAEGNVLDPENIDLRCDYLGQEDPLNPGNYRDGQEPRANFIPPNASVQVLFQGADAIVPGSKEVDPDTVTPWSPDASIADALQFLRYKVVFDVAADGSDPSVRSPRPAVQWVSIRSDF